MKDQFVLIVCSYIASFYAYYYTLWLHRAIKRGLESKVIEKKESKTIAYLAVIAVGCAGYYTSFIWGLMIGMIVMFFTIRILVHIHYEIERYLEIN